MLIYDTHTLAGVIEDRLWNPSTFLLDLFFPYVQDFDTETIDFDILTTKAKLAPFVHPDASAKPTTNGGYVTKTFKPANIKMLTAVKPSNTLKRRAGEPYGGNMSPAARLDALMFDIFDEHERAILRRKEWMAAQALRFGKIDVEGEDFPKQTIDYGRPASHRVVLAGVNRWGQAGVDVLDTIETWATTVQDACGVAPNVVVLGSGAWKLARADEKLMKLLDLRRQASGLIELGPISVNDVSRARYVGTIGDFEFWVYSQNYQDDAEATQPFLDPLELILGSPAVQGIRASGAILDVDSLVPQDIFRKSYNTENPSRRQAYSEAAPLVIPSRPSAALCAKVG
ncbi:capsid protein [Rhodomicrobium udaipurense JA643]|uniref:Major capsid protein n=1 Tax=Rhodomicrobium udaipurense TaxID=1202716 RepID=A0A8I1G9Z7_9HYPH|nr:major capsid protein [Rhodomicrobium udaipurense]KAI94088.1 capsid protein [Rhodomicrobium udaipurense JA643]MBJ7543257.1 major capsid protein [Rhodomicrobium udaipurense]